MATDAERIGPYRIAGRLGAGGMGEVFDAWDERLDRRVAVKRIRTDGTAAAEPRRRERFLWEARAAARLSHPAIVQIYDLVESLDGDWIVMEHVPGVPLSRLLGEGPLAMASVLPLAREIAEGLAEAHGKGILHRDLKTENVIVTPAGHAKILDFGLAKRFWPAAAGAADGALSSAGTLAGTRRAMSPEQAGGLQLDPRSDLFSFGTLLYEMVTGVSPFAAPSPDLTLGRVLTHQPAAAGERNPAVPAALSSLIDELLAKDRERRPPSAAAVAERLAAMHESAYGSEPGRRALAAAAQESTIVAAAAPGATTAVPGPALAAAPGAAPLPTAVRRRRPGRATGVTLAVVLAAALAGGALWTWRWRQAAAPLYVAVPAPVVGLGGGSPAVELAAAGVRSAALRGLVALAGIAPLAPEEEGGGPGAAGAATDLRPSPPAPAARLAAVAASPPRLRAVALALAADEALASRLDCQEQVCRVTLSRRAGADGRLLWTDSFEVPLDDFYLAAAAIAASLRRGYPGYALRPGIPEVEVRGEDYSRYLRLASAPRPATAGARLDSMLGEAESVRRGSPRFLEIYLLVADLERTRFFSSRERSDLDRALDLLRQARALAPGDPRPAQKLFEVALGAERLAEAEAALADLERLAPGDAETLAWRAALAERRNAGRQALALMRTAARRRPSRKILLNLALLESRQGQAAAAERTLDGLLERFPDDAWCRALLAQIELLQGSPERAAALYAGLARVNPDFSTLSNLGLAQLLLGRYGEAAATLGRGAALAPSNAVAILNLADAQLMAGRRQEAAALYGRVLTLAAQDPAGGAWQPLSVKAQALAHLGRGREAVAAVQQALALAPQDPQLAYEAALVYAVAGDAASAAANAERALASGVASRWFRFPWFDSLRADPALRVRLSASFWPTAPPLGPAVPSAAG